MHLPELIDLKLQITTSSIVVSYIRLAFAPDYRTNLGLVDVYNPVIALVYLVLIHIHLLIESLSSHPFADIYA